MVGPVRCVQGTELRCTGAEEGQYSIDGKGAGEGQYSLDGDAEVVKNLSSELRGVLCRRQ